VQACAALTLTVFGYGVPLLTNPFGDPIVTVGRSLPLTVAWVVALTNAINLIDGLDGLATGVVAIACGALWVTGRGHGDFYVMFLATILLGACGGVPGWNRPPARIFMGDTGSQFLGLMLSALSLLENRKGTAALTLLLPLVALGVPLADGTLAFVRRALRGQPVFRGDAGHIHHRLLDAGLSSQATLAVLWGLSAMFGGAAILLEPRAARVDGAGRQRARRGAVRGAVRGAAPRPDPAAPERLSRGSPVGQPGGRACARPAVQGAKRAWAWSSGSARGGSVRAACASARRRRATWNGAPPDSVTAWSSSMRSRPPCAAAPASGHGAPAPRREHAAGHVVRHLAHLEPHPSTLLRALERKALAGVRPRTTARTRPRTRVRRRPCAPAGAPLPRRHAPRPRP
jgi:hypothetical protein